MTQDTTVAGHPASVPAPPLTRTQVAHAVVRRHAGYGAVAGLIPLPVFDAFAITGVQVKMISELAEVYGLSFSRNSVKAIVASVIGGVLPVSPVGGAMLSAARFVPVVGPLLGVAVVPAFASALTWAVGRAFTNHFENGGDLGSIDLSSIKEQVKRGLGSAPAGAPAAAPAPAPATGTARTAT
jgi:uncharacterized protein (DUF697 family)